MNSFRVIVITISRECQSCGVIGICRVDICKSLEKCARLMPVVILVVGCIGTVDESKLIGRAGDLCVDNKGKSYYGSNV
jgi:hypothetical protein